MDFCHVHFLRHELHHLVPDFFLKLSGVFVAGGLDRLGSSDEALDSIPFLTGICSSYLVLRVIVFLDVFPDSGSTPFAVGRPEAYFSIVREACTCRAPWGDSVSHKVFV